MENTLTGATTFLVFSRGSPPMLCVVTESDLSTPGTKLVNLGT